MVFRDMGRWVGKTLWDAVQDLKQDMKELEVNLPKDYVTKEDYKSDIRDIKEMLKEWSPVKLIEVKGSTEERIATIKKALFS